MKQAFRAAVTAVIGLLSAALLVACGDDGLLPDDATFSAEIRRTQFGIPHIKAADEKGLGYGVGYAFAEDNFCLLADVVVSVNGERSKYFGPTTTYDPSGRGQQLNLSSDFYFKSLNDPALVQATWDRQSTEIKDLVTGYVAGVNRYLRDKGVASLPAACKDQPWVRPITTLDIMRLMRRYAVEASGAQLMDALYAAQPPAAALAVNERATLSKRAAAGAVAGAVKGAAATPVAASAAAYIPPAPGFWAQRFDTSRLGSNGVALGKDSTASGSGLLLANPHFPWVTALRFYQLHLTIPGKLDVMGASLTGFPGVNIGFNRNVAWTHTVNSSRHFTLFYLALDPADPTRYLIDGQSKPMTRRTLTVEVPDGKGGFTPVTRTQYATEHGPLIKIPGQLEWTASAAFALRDANADNDRLFMQWWEMDKADSIQAFKSSVETLLGIPWVQSIATDKAGNAYYADLTPVPHVTAAKEAACIGAPFRPLIAQGLYVLAGTTAACNWGDSADAPQRGIFAARELPSLMRTDYVQNSNDSAWFTHPAQPLTGFPSIVSIDGKELSGRTRIGLSQIAARLAGSDGLPGNRFDMASLQSIAFSNRSYFAGQLLDDLRTACAGGGSVTVDGSAVDITRGCQVMASWDGKAELSSVGWPLFFAWQQSIKASGVNFWTVPFDVADPVNTPRGLRVSDAAVTEAARVAMARAMRSLDQQSLDYTRPWGEIQVAVRGAKRIPMHGGNSADIYNAIVSVPIGDGQFDVRFGSSTIWTVSFDGDVPRAEGFLTYSQSTDPTSAHFSDQTERFSAKQWIRFPFTEAAISADPTLTTQRLRE
ncbi:penicillin acylase family protein [Roseateles amylovorans]|uniref:Penicillin acylase family protein n=1 Tax=Roseateles amylovorans TaxID=2978473 RepID=A0ABY6AXR9_9BURK|nr:penicillin acylase family protein [Roseateles amylovorans]UXH77098.1 penicillin acylase family protein [Roseateles amylovorans]